MGTSNSDEKDSSPKALIFLVLLSDLLFTGIIFGWAPFLLMMKNERQYIELCESPDEVDHCEAQENKLNVMFAIASFAVNAGALPVGIFLDKFGPRITVTLAAVIEVTGLICMAIADSKTLDIFLPGFTLLAVGGQITMLASYPASFVAPRYQTIILALISCLFDGSSVVFLLFYSFQNMFNISRFELFTAYGVLAVAVYSGLVFQWSLNEKALEENDEEDMEEKVALLSTPLMDKKHTRQRMKELYVEYGSLTEERVSLSSSGGGRTSEDGAAQKSETMYEKYSTGEVATELDKYPLKAQLLTFEFVFGLVFASLQVLRANVYIGTNNKLLENYGDGTFNHFYTKLFGFILPLGFIFVPAIDYVVESFSGLYPSLMVTNLLGLTYNVLMMTGYVGPLVIQAFVFVIFTGFRAFLYAVLSAYNAQIFGLRNLGTIVGIVFTTGSIVNLIEIPAVTISNNSFNGDLTMLCSVMLSIQIFLILLTVFCYKKREKMREEHHLQLLSTTGPFSPQHNEASAGFRRAPPIHTPSPGRVLLSERQ